MGLSPDGRRFRSRHNPRPIFPNQPHRRRGNHGISNLRQLFHHLRLAALALSRRHGHSIQPVLPAAGPFDFSGLSKAETARTVLADWNVSHLYLHRTISGPAAQLCPRPPIHWNCCAAFRCRTRVNFNVRRLWFDDYCRVHGSPIRSNAQMVAGGRPLRPGLRVVHGGVQLSNPDRKFGR